MIPTCDILAETAAMKIWAKKAATTYQGDSKAYGSGYLAATEHIETWLACRLGMPWAAKPGEHNPAAPLT
mgnify:FL=1|jgi:hypothetical protein